MNRAWSGRCTALLGLLIGLASSPLPAAGQQPTRWVAGELVVGFRAGVSPTLRTGFYRAHGATFVESVGRNAGIVRIRVPAATLDATMAKIAKLPQVRFVEKNLVFDGALVPNDPEYPTQWHLERIGATQAWDTTQGASGAVIAILDSGVDPTHPDLAGKLVAGINTYSASAGTADSFGHGTEVAGAAAAITNNAEGVAGVAGASPIMPVRVTNASGSATSTSIANGIVWAVDHGAKVLNLSFGGIAGNATIGSAAQYAYTHGALVVAASGNCGCTDPTAETPYILSVASTDENDASAAFSTVGPFVDVSAPGTNIATTAMFGLYTTDSGTSLSSPIVAGVASLMFAANPTLSPATVTQLIESTALDIGNDGRDARFGHGRVQAAAAVSAAAHYLPPPDTTPPTLSIGSPAQGATVSGSVVVAATASDDVAVAKVELSVNGVPYAADTTSPYSFAWDTSALQNGPYTLQLTATDTAGNSSSGTVSVTLNNVPPDTQPPSLSIGSPTAGSSVSGTTTVSVNAADNVGVASVQLLVDGTAIGTATASPYVFAWNTLGYANGTHTLQAVAKDAAGNSATTSASVTVANPSNRPPLAVNDAYTVPARTKPSYTARVLNVLSNDSDPDNNLKASSVTIVRAPAKGGTVSVSANGTIGYTPKQNFRGVESFDYTVKDTQGAVSNIATVTITVQ